MPTFGCQIETKKRRRDDQKEKPSLKTDRDDDKYSDQKGNQNKFKNYSFSSERHAALGNANP